MQYRTAYTWNDDAHMGGLYNEAPSVPLGTGSQVSDWLHAPPASPPIPSEHDYQYTRVIMPRKICRHCGLSRRQGMKRCKNCMEAIYCSKKCQIADWRSGHKGFCGYFPFFPRLTYDQDVAVGMSLGMNISAFAKTLSVLWAYVGVLEGTGVVTDMMDILIFQRGLPLSLHNVQGLSPFKLQWLLNAGFDPNELPQDSWWWIKLCETWPNVPDLQALESSHTLSLESGSMLTRLFLLGLKPKTDDTEEVDWNLSAEGKNRVDTAVQLATAARVARADMVNDTLMTLMQLNVQGVVDVCLRYIGNEIELPKRIQVLDPNYHLFD